MNQDATQRDFNIAINYKSLVSSLNIASNHLKIGTKEYNDLAVKLEDVSKILDGIEPATSYRKLTDDQRQAVDDIKPLLRDVMKLSKKGEKSKDANVQKYAKEIASDVKRVSARWISYLHASKSSKAYSSPALGTKEDNAEVTEEAKRLSASTSEIAKLVASSANIMSAYRAPEPAPPVVIDDSIKQEPEPAKLAKFPTELFNKTLSSISIGISTFAEAIGEFAKGISEAYAQMMEGVGNILDNPLESAISIMRGMTALLNASMSMLTGIIDSITSFLSSILDGPSGSKSKKSQVGSKLTVVTTIVNTVLSIISSIISIAMQAIQAGFNIFASTLTAIFKLVKKIADTSPVIRAIMDLLNMAFTLFFMPFMNSFALVLLPYVVELLNWAAQLGQKYAGLGEEIGQAFVDIIFNDKELIDRVKSIATSFIDDFLPRFLTEVLPDLLDFALKFTATILDNKDLLISFLKSGLSAFSAMIENGIMKTFLQFGKDVMVWLSSNAKTIVEFSTSVLGGLLKIAKLFMGFVGGSDAKEDVSEAIENIEIIEKSLSESGIYEDLEDVGKSIEKTNIPQVGTTTENPLLNPPLTPTGNTAAPTGGVPQVPGTDEGGLTDEEIKDINKEPTITVNYPNDVMSTGEFNSMVKSGVNKASERSTYKG